jgi:hypothetical protein
MFLTPGSRARARLTSLWKAIGPAIYYTGGQVLIGTKIANTSTYLEINRNAAGPQLPVGGLDQVRITAADGNPAAFVSDSFSQQGFFIMRRANGTGANKTAIMGGNAIAAVFGQGYDGSAYSGAAAGIDVTAFNNWSGADHSALVRVYTTPLGSTTLQEVSRFSASGGLSVGTTTDAGNGNALLSGFLNTGGFARVSSQFDKTSDAALANVPGLSATLAAGKSYFFRAVLFTAANVAGGVQASIAGTATATAVRYEALVHDAAAVKAQTRATALGTAVGGVTAVTAAKIEIEGLITVNAGGTLTVQFAQNASNATASSVLTGSTLSVLQIT